MRRSSKMSIRRRRKTRYVVFFLVGESPASEFYMPMFRNTPSVPPS